MDLVKLGKKIESFLKKEMNAFESLEKPGKDGASWAYVINDGIMGYIALEKLDDMDEMPIISICVCICDVMDLGYDELLEVLEANADLLGASFCVPPFVDADGAQSLAVQARVPAEGFEPDVLMPIIDGLLVYASQVFSEEDDDDEEDDEDLEEDGIFDEECDENAEIDKNDIPF